MLLILGGGASHGDDFGTGQANSEVFDGTAWGVLKLTLSPGAYSWTFVPAAGSSSADAGTANGH